MTTLPSNRRSASKIVVRSLSPRATRGVLTFGNLSFPCVLGFNGRRVDKREGDNASPIGTFALRSARYRPDKLLRPRTGLPIRAIQRDDGWCDTPRDRNYNRPVRLPYPARCEKLWRDDGLYDAMIILDHNERPRVHGGGSAVFIHIARPGMTPTEGCIALQRHHLLRLLEAIGSQPGVVQIVIPA
ncbi:L,D-transpeptidase family protein [Hyphomicrobium sp. D-2]|uniref:L,D-transpeptidase family protein n=1 Tax=Hyphomicrobium sp. D-2 TaxID=3041621 RepID=UPI002454F66D|nr:L,D-transpeptidase family protein [Hyphomicrobium sp. D-2]MDH4983456.1 L,D-transpeptidase family protein [Hyphomicrobium sp. D-2]